ncbi:MAG: acetyl-CoA C-acetyltransferase [Frankiaceae bacterium]|nr:acetyl-CoA C-acetyltransferase [Frankiaceae bacterium]
MPGSVIVAGARTPIGKMGGALASFSAMDLGGFAISAALQRAGVAGSDIDYVILGHVIRAGQGQIPARQAAVKGGIPMSVPALSIDKVCLSGLEAIALADLFVSSGVHRAVVAGGMESMTNGPWLLPGARKGYSYGDRTIHDATERDGLFDAFEQVSMGAATEKFGRRLNITREEQDEYSARSHERAADAMKAGRFDNEIAGVEVPQRKGDPIQVTEDEGVRPGTTAEGLAKLPPAFDREEGTITAASSSQISDGACAVLVTSRAFAEERGLPILAEIGQAGYVAGPDPSLQSQPSNAIRQALTKEGLAPGDVDLFEMNEAFAQVAIQSMRELEVSDDKVNVNGGAISLGHPIGMSGARIALTLALELQRRGGGLGVAGLCGGGGQGNALVLRVPA